ncbi:TetR family transcriptional regulator [Pseudomonas fluorescens BRIP34879]|uniref:TetR/AcrR family transcriptional regulator n=1 Tax=Pseudomonas salmasensis TaxID=2745514 RepID=UPI0002A79E8B|nr:TetR/AcrR family transcriptional regulator [Pseudomonas salmasensis]ELQ17989.1 TetR family transcriptional regulator [Pseudomonas fluorescens BRIP34879]QXH78047.1 TetR/AcrR family transcriptional regulator [Pseudomonas salmasensis]
MKVLSPSASRICDIALVHFAERGYDASSLNEIAVVAGMRKPSLYAHFKSKDDLFNAVLNLALATERHYIEEMFASVPANDDEPGKLYTDNLSNRYESSAALRFLLRTAFFPPSELKASVTTGFEAYLDLLRERFGAGLENRYPALSANEISMFQDAYIGVIDSLHVELIYCSEGTYRRRLAALWRILGDSLSLAVGKGAHG